MVVEDKTKRCNNEERKTTNKMNEDMIDALKKPWNRMPVIHISSWKRLLGLDTRP